MFAINNIMANTKKRIITNCLHCLKQFEFLPKHTKGKYCNLICQSNNRKLNNYKRDKLLFEKGYLKYRDRIKIFVKERDGEKCSSCLNKEWKGEKIPLWLDHIDGNATNNNPSNFRLICPNCDSLNPTFGGKNRGNGRRSRGLKPWS